VDVILIDAVLESHDVTEGFSAWPVAEPAGDLILELCGQMTWAEVGTAMAVLFCYNDIPAEPISDLHHLLDRHLAEAEALVAGAGYASGTHPPAQ
jgi:hypothetical protein